MPIIIFNNPNRPNQSKVILHKNFDITRGKTMNLMMDMIASRLAFMNMNIKNYSIQNIALNILFLTLWCCCCFSVVLWFFIQLLHRNVYKLDNDDDADVDCYYYYAQQQSRKIIKFYLMRLYEFWKLNLNGFFMLYIFWNIVLVFWGCFSWKEIEAIIWQYVWLIFMEVKLN